MVMTITHDADLVLLLNAIQTACKLIARSVRKAGIAGLCKIIIITTIIIIINQYIHFRFKF